MNVFGHIEIGAAEEIAAASVPDPNETRIVREMREIVAGPHPAQQGRGLPRRGGEEGGGPADVQAGHPRPRGARRGGEPLLEALPGAGGPEPRQEAAAARHARPGRQDRRSVHGELLALPERPRPLGVRPALPIVPLHRLDEAPTRDCTIVDITCDSDGRIDRFIERGGRRRDAVAPRPEARRALLPRAHAHRRLPGRHGRHAQPLRPGERDPRLRGRRGSGGLLHRGGHPRRPHRAGAVAHAVRARTTSPAG